MHPAALPPGAVPGRIISGEPRVGPHRTFATATAGPTLHAHLGECLPGAPPVHAQRATFVLSILSLAPSLSSPWEIPQVDHTRLQTFPARHLV